MPANRIVVACQWFLEFIELIGFIESIVSIELVELIGLLGFTRFLGLTLFLEFLAFLLVLQKIRYKSAVEFGNFLCLIVDLLKFLLRKIILIQGNISLALNFGS